MKHITEDDLTLLYYGEHDDPDLAATVAGSPELTARFEALSAEIGRLDDLIPPQRGDDYGADVWRRISTQLTGVPARPANRLQSWIAGLKQPRFSWAGALSLALVATLAFMLGRQGSETPNAAPAIAEQAPPVVQKDLGAERLLTSSVSDYLEQLNLVFTEFANSTETPFSGSEQVMDMLVANRLYRQAAISRGDHQLAAFLSGLEPVLIEIAHEAYAGSPVTHARIRQEIEGSLLFRIRYMNKQLENTPIST